MYFNNGLLHTFTTHVHVADGIYTPQPMQANHTPTTHVLILRWSHGQKYTDNACTILTQ